MSGPQGEFHYDVCLSYASDERAFVEAVANALRELDIEVFVDTYERARLWGKDLYRHLDSIYREQARFCVIFASANFARKVWPTRELQSAQARALTSDQEYILPVRFDDTEIPGLAPTIAYVDVRTGLQPDDIAALVAEKVREFRPEPEAPDDKGSVNFDDSFWAFQAEQYVAHPVPKPAPDDVGLQPWERRTPIRGQLSLPVHDESEIGSLAAWARVEAELLGFESLETKRDRHILMSAQLDIDPCVEDPGPIRPVFARGNPGPLNVLARARESVHAVAFGELDGTPILAATHGSPYDDSVQIWDLTDGSAAGAVLDGHTGSIWSIAIGAGAGGTLVATGETGHDDGDGAVRIWDARTRKLLIGPIRAHAGVVRAVQFVRLTGKLVLASADAGRDGRAATVRFWDAATGREQAPPLTGIDGSVMALAFGRVGDKLVLAVAESGESDDFGSSNGSVTMWDTATWSRIGPRLRGHSGWVSDVAFLPAEAGTVLATAGAHDGTIRLWDMSTFRQRGRQLRGHRAGVRSLAVGELDGRTVIVSGGNDDAVRIWDPTAAKQIGPALLGHTSSVYCVAIGKAGERTLVASGSVDQSLRLWDPMKPPKTNPATIGSLRAKAVALARADGRLLLAAGGEGYEKDRAVRLWSIADGTEFGLPFTGHPGDVKAIAFVSLPDREALAIGGENARITLWDIATGAPVGNGLRGHPDGVNGLVATIDDGRALLASAVAGRVGRVGSGVKVVVVVGPSVGGVRCGPGRVRGVAPR